MADQDTRYRLVLLGASRTGKSSIIHMFLNGKFLNTYKETVEDLHYREFTIDDKTIKVDILDTAGKFSSIIERSPSNPIQVIWNFRQCVVYRLLHLMHSFSSTVSSRCSLSVLIIEETANRCG